MSTNVFSNKHILFMTPLLVNDDKSDWIHLIIGNCEGLDTRVLDKTKEGPIGEYHAISGDIYPVTAVGFGYVLERPKAEAFNVVDFINEEAGGIQGHVGDDTFDSLIKPEHIHFAGIFQGTVEGEEGEEDTPVTDVLVQAFKHSSPEGLHLTNGDVVPLGKVTQYNGVIHGYTVQLVDVDPVVWIEEHLSHLVKATSEGPEGEQVFYVADTFPLSVVEIN